MSRLLQHWMIILPRAVKSKLKRKVKLIGKRDWHRKSQAYAHVNVSRLMQNDEAVFA